MSGYQEGDVVVLQQDLPEAGLRRGMMGAVVTCFDTPMVAYETEFCDADGATIAQLALLPAQITPAVTAEPRRD
jgi:hypothetical protein